MILNFNFQYLANRIFSIYSTLSESLQKRLSTLLIFVNYCKSWSLFGITFKRTDNMNIMQKEIALANSPIIFEDDFLSNDLNENWNVKSGEWEVKDGWCYGKHRDNSPGMIISKRGFPGDVIVEFEAQNVLPSDHDINLMWNGSWNDSINKRGEAYVAGLQGWWEGKVGIEKSPDYKLNAGTPLFCYDPGRKYHIMAGSINGHCFIFVDGKLALEVTDPTPIDNIKNDKVGFEAYCSHIKIAKVRIRQVKWKERQLKYTPDF